MMRTIILQVFCILVLSVASALGNPDSVKIYNGDLRISGVGNGLVFADGSVQTRAADLLTFSNLVSSNCTGVGQCFCPTTQGYTSIAIQGGIVCSGNNRAVVNSQGMKDNWFGGDCTMFNPDGSTAELLPATLWVSCILLPN
jgi:hypothetical protein